MDIICDSCEKPITGLMTNVGSSMEVILLCAGCVRKIGFEVVENSDWFKNLSA